MSFLIGGLFALVSLFALLSVGSLTSELNGVRANRDANEAYRASGTRAEKLLGFTGYGPNVQETHARSAWYTIIAHDVAQGVEAERRGDISAALGFYAAAQKKASHESHRSTTLRSDIPNADERADAFHDATRVLSSHMQGLQEFGRRTHDNPESPSAEETKVYGDLGISPASIPEGVRGKILRAARLEREAQTPEDILNAKNAWGEVDQDRYLVGGSRFSPESRELGKVADAHILYLEERLAESTRRERPSFRA